MMLAATAAPNFSTTQSWAAMSYEKLLLPKFTLNWSIWWKRNAGNKIPFTLLNATPFCRWFVSDFNPKKQFLVYRSIGQSSPRVIPFLVKNIFPVCILMPQPTVSPLPYRLPYLKSEAPGLPQYLYPLLL